MASLASSSPSPGHVKTVEELRATHKEEQVLSLRGLIEETLDQPGNITKHLNKILGNYRLTWEVIEELALKKQHRLMDIFLLVSAESRSSIP
jgi:hypothetical protein